MNQEKIDRINQLAKKAKTVGLTKEEEDDQKDLRQEYIKAFRSNMKQTLDNVVVVDPDGSKRSLRKDT